MFNLSKKSYLFIGLPAVAMGASLALLTSSAQAPTPRSQPAFNVNLAAASPAGAAIPGADQEVLRFTLAAGKRDVNVQDIKFVKKGTCSSRGIGEVKLVDGDDPTIIYASLPAGTAWFAGNSFSLRGFSTPLIIASQAEKTIVLRGDTSGCNGSVRFSIPANGVVAQYLQPTIVYAGNVVGGAIKFSATQVIKPNTESLFAKLSSATPNGAVVPGLSEVLRFTLTTQPGKDIVIDELSFKPTYTCERISDPSASLYDEKDITTSLKSWTWSEKTGFVDGFTASGLNKAISAGDTKTFVLKFNTTGCGAGKNDTLRMDLQGGKWHVYDSKVPSTASVITNTPLAGGTIQFFAAPILSSVSATLSPVSPVGAGIPGIAEVLRFTIVAQGNKDIVIDELNFKSTNTCQNFLSPRADLYDAADMATPIRSFLWYTADELNKTIAAGTAKTFVFKFDTTGCSASKDDAFRLDLAGGRWHAYDSSVTSTAIANTPILGGTIVY